MLVVFDLDGTLIDSVRDLAESTNEVIVSYGAEPLPPEAVAAMIGEGARKLVVRALAARRLTVPADEALERFFAIYDRRLLNHTRPYDGVVDAVRELSSRGPLAVLTNKPEAPARRLLEAFDIADRFRWIVGGDGPFPRKPDPRSLLHVMLQAAMPAERTVLVGDSAPRRRVEPACVCASPAMDSDRRAVPSRRTRTISSSTIPVTSCGSSASCSTGGADS
jgi:phosphoglycolate phosphatase